MRKVDQLLYEYGLSHQNDTNKTIHWVCVPLIFFSIVGLIWSIPAEFLQNSFPGPAGKFINWATIGLLLALIYYATLSIPLFVGMLIISLTFLFLCYFLEGLGVAPLWLISLVIFFLAWIGQFYGHKVEGKKPSFLKDVQFLLIGPAWLMSFIYKRLNITY